MHQSLLFIAAGIAAALGSALVKPAIGVASVQISPLNLSLSRRRPFINDPQRLAGRKRTR